MTSAREDVFVGPYRLLAPLGEGGMGVVHLAMAPDGRRVALKVLRPHIVGDQEARERLAREVSSLRRITSPRIAEILDADPDGPVPYVVTRYVPGLPLYHHVAEEGPITGRDLVHAADCLAEALGAVHAGGVLHRDIKPTNVLMEGRSPVLIDFGLARVAEDPRLTQTGWLLGTPGYLAPEILYGEEASPASDVHAWAATLVFAATGRPPYGGGPAMAIMDRVRRGEHDLGGVPAPMSALLARCLAPEPEDRPTLPQVRQWLAQERAGQDGTRRGDLPVAAAPAPELWTMPFAPTPVPGQETDVVPLASAAHEEDPAAAATTTFPAYREAEPYQRPPAVAPAPTTTLAPGPPAWLAPTPTEPSRAQRVLQLAGLAALAGATVAYAPYLGTALVGLAVLLLRAGSITRQRHDRRRRLRGRERWYDVPASVLASPGYLALALLGTVSGVVVGAVVGLAMFSIGYLLQLRIAVCLVLAGIGFVPTLWWGPGSQRLRESTRSLVTRTARTEFLGWFVAVMGAVGAAALLGVLLSAGPNWAPDVAAPWNR
ncbi:serine/threonine-protein kinase [Nocardioides scoriae]|uniref:serine/threonine-protein kinase n=1 Tax=Nocardioides scoriae TaxID=642780 RepID=UPI000B873271|nr:serine/threonine-protein kinase [Nocardioides scoriae]